MFNTCFKSITNIAQYLHDNKQHITEVKNYINDLKYVISDNFCNSDITKINEIRINIGKLVKYIEQEKVENIISDFTDNIESLNDTIDEPNNCHIDINQHRTFEQRISIYIENNKTNDLVKEVISYSKPSNDSIKKFKEEIQKYVQNQEEFNSLFPDDNSIPVFIRKKLGISKDAIDKFIANQQNNSYSSDQKNYIRKLLEYISRNGSFDNSILIQDDFLFGNLFTEAQIHKIISDIKNRL